MKMQAGEDEPEYLGSPDAKRRRLLDRSGAALEFTVTSPPNDPFASLGIHPNFALAAGSHVNQSETHISSGQNGLFAAPTSSSTLGASFGLPDQDPAQAVGRFPLVSNQSFQSRISQLGLQSFLPNHFGFHPPSGDVQQVDQSALLQNLMMGAAAAPLSSYGAPHPSVIMRDVLMRDNALHFMSQMGTDQSSAAYGGGMLPPLLSAVPGSSVNASVGDLMAAQMYRSAAAAPPVAYPHPLLNSEVLGAFPTLADYARLEARGNELGQTFQIQRSTLGLESQPGRQNAASVSSTSTTRKPSSSAKTRDPVSMFRPSDEEVLAEYQCLLRRQIEFFEASPEDVSSNAQGRNKPIQLGQIGIRCIHCVHLPPKKRPRGAVYYPSKLFSVYQSAQNMAVNHFQTRCPNIPESLSDALAEFKEKKCHVHGGGKQYWASTAQSLGIVEVENGLEFEK